METVKIIECPRDAMQGVKSFIPTEHKIVYIQSLLRVGFDTIDFGSFVSPKWVPQMKDTAAVLAGLDLSQTRSKLLVITASVEGAKTAASFSEIAYLGFPFSISEKFQMQNTHKTISQSLISLQEILAIADAVNKQVVVYLSMGFGNPYGDFWSVDVVAEWVEKLVAIGVKTISISDTVGVSTPETIRYLFSNLIVSYSHIEFGAHLHTMPDSWFEKIDTAYKAGCKRFDGVIQGFGGCPMATNHLTGNMPTEKLFSYFVEQKADSNLRAMSFESAYNETSKLFRNRY